MSDGQYGDPFDVKMTGEEHPEWTIEEYHADDALGRSGLYNLATLSPYEYRHLEEKDRGDATDSQLLGTAFHTLVLEPHRFEETVWRCEGTRTPKKKKEAKEAGAVLLTPAMFFKVLEMREFLATVPGMDQLFEGALIEHSMTWTHAATGLRCKTRPDSIDFARRRVVDVKTTNDIGIWKMMRACREYGYHMQGSMFIDGAAECGHPIDEVWHLCMRTTGAPMVALIKLPDVAIDEGRRLHGEACETFARCTEENHWPAPELKPEEMPWEMSQ